MLEIGGIEDINETWQLSECPRKFVSGIVDEINLAQVADDHLPCSGGVLDQSAWWVECWMAFKSDCSQIDQDRIDRERRRYG